MTLGFVAAIGVPVVDQVVRLPGFAQSPLIFIGLSVALLAIGCGMAAIRLPTTRNLGVVGLVLGVVALVIIPLLLARL